MREEVCIHRTPDEPDVLSVAFSLSTFQSPTLCMAVTMASSVELSSGSRLDLTDAGKMNGSCVRQVSLSLTTDPGTVARSMSSRTSLPETMLIKRRIASVDELFPLCSLPLAQCQISVAATVYLLSRPANYANLLTTFDREADILENRRC